MREQGITLGRWGYCRVPKGTVSRPKLLLLLDGISERTDTLDFILLGDVGEALPGVGSGSHPGGGMGGHSPGHSTGTINWRRSVCEGSGKKDRQAGRAPGAGPPVEKIPQKINLSPFS